jgi:hypothetical protein
LQRWLTEVDQNILPMPGPVAARSKACVLTALIPGSWGSNPSQGMDMSSYFCVVLSCGDRGPASDRSSIQGVLPILEVVGTDHNAQSAKACDDDHGNRLLQSFSNCDTIATVQWCTGLVRNNQRAKEIFPAINAVT